MYYAKVIIPIMVVLAGQNLRLETEDSEDVPVYNIFAKPHPTQLIVVVSDYCGPCQKLKRETIPTLQKEGYSVTIVDHKDWTRTEITSVPLLVYLRKDKIMYTEVGFRTPEQIKERLRKP